MSASNASLLSVAIISRDDASELTKTIESIRGIADQVVVVDTGSIDGTPDVARELGAEVIDFAWTDDFSAARNAAWQAATCGWVLWLDAGETISDEDATELRQTISSDETQATAYAMLVCVPPSSATAPPEQIAQTRLVPNRPGLEFQGRVRESLGESLAANGITVEGAPLRIQRGSRDNDPDTKVARARRNVRLADLEISESGAQPRLLNCLGDALQTLEDNDRARQFYQHALSASEPGSPEMLEAYYGLITSLDGSPDSTDEQLALCVEAIKVFPLDAQLLCAMGGYLQTQGQHELALKTYQTAQQFGQINPMVWHIGEIREIATICYVLSLQLGGREDEGGRLLHESLEAHPDSIRLRRHSIETLVNRAERDKALAEVDRLPSDYPDRNALRSAVRGACLAADKNWLVAKSYLTTAFEAGCRDPICLRWLATTLISTGDLPAATPILRVWKTVEPGNKVIDQYLVAIENAGSAVATQTPTEVDGKQVRIDAADNAPSSPSTPHSVPQSSSTHRVTE